MIGTPSGVSASARFPEGVNVVIAAALAGPGLDATHVLLAMLRRETARIVIG